MDASRCGELSLNHGLEQCSAIGDLAGTGMDATKLKVLNDIVFDIQHADQGDFFLFTVRASPHQ